MGILSFSNHKLLPTNYSNSHNTVRYYNNNNNNNNKMKLFAVISAVSAGWTGQCQPNPSVDPVAEPEWTDGSWVEKCGEQYTFQPVNATCTYAANNYEAHKFLGGGAFISGENEFFGIDGLSSTEGDLVVFYENDDSYCQYNWWNGSNNGIEDGGYEHADAVTAECTSTGVTCVDTVFVPAAGQYYFMETTNDYRQAKVANYNFQFWGANEAVDYAIYVGDHNDTLVEDGSYSVDHKQYNKKQFTINIQGSEGRGMALMNLTCFDCEFAYTCTRNPPSELCNTEAGVYRDGDTFATDTGVIVLSTGDQVNSQLYGFSGVQQPGETQIPNMWKSSVAGSSL